MFYSSFSIHCHSNVFVMLICFFCNNASEVLFAFSGNAVTVFTNSDNSLSGLNKSSFKLFPQCRKLISIEATPFFSSEVLFFFFSQMTFHPLPHSSERPQRGGIALWTQILHIFSSGNENKIKRNL